MPPPPHTQPHIRTGIDTRILELEPDEQWKADLCKRIERGFFHLVEDTQIIRNTTLNSQPSEESRERAQRDYEESMHNIRMLAQEEFNSLLRQERSERKWALDAVGSNLSDVAEQQQWILDNIRKADEERPPIPPTDAPQNAEGVLSGNVKQGPDESSEYGYGTGGLEDGEGESDELEGSSDEEWGEEEDGDEVDHNPRQSRPPSRSHVPLTQPLHPNSSVSPRNAPSFQRQPLNSQPAEENDDDEVDDPHMHPPWRHGSQGNQPYSPGGAPRHQSSGFQASVWRPSPRAPEPSGISRTFAHTSGQVYSTGPTSKSAGLHHRAGSMNSDQYRGSSVAPHGGTERPPPQNRDRIASNTRIAPRLRQTSASASPHDRPSPPTYPTAPRTIPGARPSLDEGIRFPVPAGPGSRPINSMQRSPEEMRQGLAIPRGPTTPEEGLRGTSWDSLNSRRPFGDSNSRDEQRLTPVEGDLSDVSDDVVGHLDDRQSVRSIRSARSTMSVEQLTASWETEARRKKEEARRLDEKARQSLEEARRLEACARQAEASAKTREAGAKKRGAEAQKHKLEAQREGDAQYLELEAWQKEEQARRKEEQTQRREEDAWKREEILKRKEVEARHREDNIGRKEEDVRQREILAQQKEEEARRMEENARRSWVEAKWIAEDYELKKREIEQREAELKKRETKLLRKEQAARQAKESSRFEFREPARDDEDTARLDVEETAQVGTSNRAVEEAQNTVPEREEQPRAIGRKGFQTQTKRQKEKVLEEQRRQKVLEEEQRLEEQRLQEERRKEEALQRERVEQIWLFDEELSRQEQARLEHEHLLTKAQESEADRIQYAEEEWYNPYGVPAEQRRKAKDKSRQRDELRQQQQQQQDEIRRQRGTREERRREFERRTAQHHQGTLERERQNSMGPPSESRATPHQPGSTTSAAGDRSNAPTSASSTWPSRLPPMSSSHKTNTLFTSSSMPPPTTPKPLPMGARLGAPGTSTAP
jgi:hypothetical protein